MSVSVWRDSAKGRDAVTVDVAVIGAGVAGIAVARQCEKRGLSCAVLEARDLAAGATGRNAGFAMTGLADSYESLVERFGRKTARELWLVSQANLDEIIDDVVGREGVACDLVPCGSVVAAWDERERAVLERSCAMLVHDGFDVRWLEGDALYAKLGSRAYHGGIFVAKDHGIHPVKLVSGIADNLAQSGVRLLFGHEVRSIEQARSQVLVRTSRADVTAGYAVLCTNAYTRTLEPALGALVRPVRGQALCLEGVDRSLDALLYTDDGFQYARPLPDGRVVAGGWRRAFADEEIGLADECSEGVQSGIERWLRERWPQWRDARVTHRWSGAMGFSPDGIPLVGTLADRPRVAYAVGFTGHGMGFAFAAARAALRRVLQEGDAGIFAIERLDRA
ncbi:MAG: FAD-binding oxidoreductase [Myxococcales bacterium]|nr:FAD-binding oxidoreductase [Myxococcales bacterium]